MLKNDLRKKALDFRKNLNVVEKKSKDDLIFNKVINLPEYLDSEIVLCYCSTEFEIDTINIIKNSLALNKKVALPKCVDSKGNMVFKYINSFDDLEMGLYDIFEPVDELIDYNFSDANAICIIPSLMVDENGFRLGYGKGYYDRFLAKFGGFKCVLCYKENIVNNLPVYDGFDVKCDLCLTD